MQLWPWLLAVRKKKLLLPHRLPLPWLLRLPTLLPLRLLPPPLTLLPLRPPLPLLLLLPKRRSNSLFADTKKPASAGFFVSAAPRVGVRGPGLA